ncbi:hypothetical protein [Ruminococcus sp.]|uniref:hypothetical protein n=1 Tax=Ruminococcus sp. TaxID=41978 RepID=UPI0025DE2BC6|nr:hypothetical protein [Ruminococcus sp.]
MARARVWIEAMEEYLIRNNLGEREKIVKLSDDKLSEYYYKVIKEKGIENDAEKFMHRWCMQYK